MVRGGGVWLVHELEDAAINKVDVKIRLIVLEDYIEIFKHISSHKAHFEDMYKWPSPYVESDAIDFVEMAVRENARGEARHWAIIVGSLCGVISLYGIDGDAARLGYWVAKEFCSRGIASESLRQLLVFEVDQGQIQTITTRVLKHNIASIRVLEKNHFVLNKNGHRTVELERGRVNEYLYSLFL